LIFLPGFSTAETLSTVSGRGVGMDVVKKTIQNLGGKINVSSQYGQGCTVTLTLPLTLAVLDGMLVRCGGSHYVIPIINIIETLRPSASQVSYLLGGAAVLHLRTATIPLIFLGRIFNIQGACTNPCHAIVVILETETGGIVGLVVDELEGQQQVVIKSLETNYEAIPGISAATIMGNGSVYPILDVNVLCHSKVQPMRQSGG
jgi:two-component system chemotaxis sensor kinase CheA